MIRPADDVCLILYIIIIGRESQAPICPRQTFRRFAKSLVLKLFRATQTLAVRDTEVQSTGRSLRMRTWVGPGALCMHERASRVSHVSLPQS
jgi:hypothetical protein